MLDIVESVGVMREELDDHLTAINENTEELESNYSYVMAFGERLAKVEDKIHFIYKKLIEKELLESESTQYSKIKLTVTEQKVFIVLYEKDRGIDYATIEQECRRSRVFIRNQINSMIEKGVPIIKNTINSKQFFSLDPGFKQLQTTENVLRLDRVLTLDCFDQGIVE